MKILTKAILAKLPKLAATDGKDSKNIPVIFKLFVPWGAGTWYVTEGQLCDEGKDYQLFGYVTGLGGDELGYFSLNELLSIRGPGGLRIERDLHFDNTTLADVMA
jgi:hypothetical protein